MTGDETKVKGTGQKRLWRYAAIIFIIVGAIGVTALLVANGTLQKLLVPSKPTEPTSRQLWTCGMHPQVIQDHPGECPICHMELTPLKSSVSTTKSTGERKIKYWWDPMLGPSSISDKPGKSAMGMDLVPVYEDALSAGSEVIIDPVVVQNMGVRTVVVTQGPLRRTIRAVGLMKEVEPNRHDVNLRVSGWIEKLHANTEGMLISKGEALFDLYSPQIQVGLGELIAARRSKVSNPNDDDNALAFRSNDNFYDSAKQKLLLLGVDKQQIDRISTLEHAPRTVTFTSPVTGHVTEQRVVEGAAVNAGERVLRIVDHSTLWLDAQIYESQLPFVQLGQKATATIEAVPGQTFDGEIIFIHPHVDEVTRTVLVRVTIPNESMTLKPSMYATVLITSELSNNSILVPRQAIIDTGTRQVTYLSQGEGHFDPRQIKIGAMGDGDMVQVLEGLALGDTVVTSGQFLLDAESRMKEAIQKHLNERRATGK